MIGIVWAIWAVAYPVVSCCPALSGGLSQNAGSAGLGALASFLIAGALFWPWIVGLIVFGVLYAVSG